MNFRYDMFPVVGIDEVGRGPLAGPVAVCALIVLKPAALTLFNNVKDSKQLTPHGRELWFQKIKTQKESGALDFKVSYSGVKTIEQKGIVPSVYAALTRTLNMLSIDPQTVSVFLDGGLKAPERFRHQRTIIRGDEKEVVIALASIVAKVSRDRRMFLYAKRFPEYGFAKHKGYGTTEHRTAIKKHGLSKIHRRNFCAYL